MAKVDYQKIPYPHKGPEGYQSNFDFKQRRAELLKKILESGSIRIPLQENAERYGVTYAQISHDKKILVEYISKELFKPDRIISDVLAAKLRAKDEAIKNGHWRTVNAVTDSILKMAMELGVLQKAPDKVDVMVEERFKKIFAEKPRKLVIPSTEELEE